MKKSKRQVTEKFRLDQQLLKLKMFYAKLINFLKDWKARLMIERSRAIKSPTIQLVLYILKYYDNYYLFT